MGVHLTCVYLVGRYHERVSYRYVSYRSVPYRRVPHKRVPHRRVPQTGVYLIDVHLIGIRLIKHNDSPTLTIDRIQPFYLIVRKYLRLSVVAGISHFGAKCELALLSEWAAAGVTPGTVAGRARGDFQSSWHHVWFVCIGFFCKQNFVGEKVKCQTSGPVARHPGFIHPLYMLIYVPHDLLVHT
jgi:hypothetical protein